jgi:hypothetical protein
MMRRVPKPGDRVLVPFGSGEFAGEVTYISRISDPPHVQVEFKLDEDDDFTVRNLYPIDMIRPAPVPSA